MKRVIYKDKDGHAKARLLRNEDDSNFPEIGLPIEPPPIERIVRESAQEMQDEFVNRGVLTYKDVVAGQNIVSEIIRSVLLRKIVEAYKFKELEENA
jgi:hypothetical protein